MVLIVVMIVIAAFYDRNSVGADDNGRGGADYCNADGLTMVIVLARSKNNSSDNTHDADNSYPNSRIMLSMMMVAMAMDGGQDNGTNS